MEAAFLWLVERKALTLAGFVVVLVGAFVPWPSEAIAIVLVILGAGLMLAQIPFAMRAAQKVPSPPLHFPEIPSIPAAPTPAKQTSAAFAPAEPVPAAHQEAQRGD
ncbi:MAG: hypothetical protein JOZ75_03650 [Candidatus Dormibacteraeota bacterium]|nr:hypothetical protein [Candidatus Dormibacteraeota bacterium]